MVEMNQPVALVGVDLGFSVDDVVHDTKENLADLLGRVAQTVAKERSGLCVEYDPYNNISYHLSPAWPSNVEGDQETYYDQRIAIYRAVIDLVHHVRGNFYSGRIYSFLQDLEQHARRCEQHKKDVQWAKRWTAAHDRAYAIFFGAA